MSYLEKLKRLEQTERHPESTPPDVTDGRIIAVKICSHVLDACIWLAFDDDFKPDDESLAVFFASEIPILRNKTVKELRAILKAKLPFPPGARVSK